MQKPYDRDRIKALLAGDDIVDDLSTSEMSAPKGQPRLSASQPRIPQTARQAPFRPGEFSASHSSAKEIVLTPSKDRPGIETGMPERALSTVGHPKMRTAQIQAATVPSTSPNKSEKKQKRLVHSPSSHNSFSPAAKTVAPGEHILDGTRPFFSPRGCSRARKSAEAGTSLGTRNRVRKSDPRCRFCVTDTLQSVIKGQLYNKYEATTQATYNVNVINDIILNASTRIVAIFKEYLMYDDLTDFLKKSYKKKESVAKLKQLTEFYDKSSKVFPNFVALEEKKYMFKNIERKQKAIDQKHRQLVSAANRADDSSRSSNRLFTRRFLDEITMRCSRLNIQMQPQLNDKTNLEDLVERFIDRDSLSQIQKSNCESVEATFCALKPAPAIVPTLLSSSKPITAGPARPPAKKPSPPEKRRPVVAKVNNFVQGEKKAPSLISAANHRHHQSQESLRPAAAESRKGERHGNLLSGRMSAAGNYCSHTKDSAGTAAAAVTTRTKGRVKPRDAMREIDPLQININLNLVLNKEKSRCGTPQTCTAADIYRYRSLEKLQMGNSNNPTSGLVTTRARSKRPLIPPAGKVGASKLPTAPSSSTSNNSSHHHATAPTKPRDKEKKSARSTMRPRQGMVSSLSSKVSSKMVSERGSVVPLNAKVQRPRDGRASAVPQAGKRLGSLAIDQLCKNIKDMLSPMSVVGLTNDKSIIPSSKWSPRRDKLGRNAKASGPAENVYINRRGTFLPRKSEAELPRESLRALAKK